MKGKPRHWVRVTTACNNRCLFCLDADTPRDLILPVAELEQEIARGRQERGASRLILSGGEPTLHPAFVELVRYGCQQGYERVQVITNGHRLADRAFFEAAIAAGLGEITFSLHGPNAAVHDDLVGRPGAFEQLMKALVRAVRAVRDGRPIVNVDIVINGQNVALIGEIVELCISLGVTEFDLLHWIPQGRAFANRERLSYDLEAHWPALQEVFRLARHPRVTLWTNRFPVAYLEGLEDLIQAPSKLFDEVQGRRYQLRRYLDTGEPLDCRSPDRCPHCFVEPFCTTLDRIVAGQHEQTFEVWWIGADRWGPEPLPMGCRSLGVEVASLAALAARATPPGVGIYAVGVAPERLAADPLGRRPTALVATEPAQLDAWLAQALPPNVELEIHLNRRTAAWLKAHRDRLRPNLPALRLHQPSHERLAGATAEDVRDPVALFRELALPIEVSGLPPCLAPGARVVAERAILPRELFDGDTGRLSIGALARHHIATAYYAKSLRCAACPITERCEGAHIQLLRHLGLASLQPLGPGPASDAAVEDASRRWPQPRSRLATGRVPEPPAPSLPGYGPPAPPPVDPLAKHATETKPAPASDSEGSTRD